MAKINHRKTMKKNQVKIKRVKRNKKEPSNKEKLLAGLGVGAAAMGGISGGVINKTNNKNVATVSSRTKNQSKKSNTIKENLKNIFGVPTAKASGWDENWDYTQGVNYIGSTSMYGSGGMGGSVDPTDAGTSATDVYNASGNYSNIDTQTQSLGESKTDATQEQIESQLNNDAIMSGSQELTQNPPTEDIPTALDDIASVAAAGSGETGSAEVGDDNGSQDSAPVSNSNYVVPNYDSSQDPDSSYYDGGNDYEDADEGATNTQHQAETGSVDQENQTQVDDEPYEVEGDDEENLTNTGNKEVSGSSTTTGSTSGTTSSAPATTVLPWETGTIIEEPNITVSSGDVSNLSVPSSLSSSLSDIATPAPVLVAQNSAGTEIYNNNGTYQDYNGNSYSLVNNDYKQNTVFGDGQELTLITSGSNAGLYTNDFGVVCDSSGQKIQATDAEGQAVTDAQGNAIYINTNGDWVDSAGTAVNAQTVNVSGLNNSASSGVTYDKSSDIITINNVSYVNTDGVYVDKDGNALTDEEAAASIQSAGQSTAGSTGSSSSIQTVSSEITAPSQLVLTTEVGTATNGQKVYYVDNGQYKDDAGNIYKAVLEASGTVYKLDEEATNYANSFKSTTAVSSQTTTSAQVQTVSSALYNSGNDTITKDGTIYTNDGNGNYVNGSATLSASDAEDAKRTAASSTSSVASAAQTVVSVPTGVYDSTTGQMTEKPSVILDAEGNELTLISGGEYAGKYQDEYGVIYGSDGLPTGETIKTGSGETTSEGTALPTDGEINNSSGETTGLTEKAKSALTSTTNVVTSKVTSLIDSVKSNSTTSTAKNGTEIYNIGSKSSPLWIDFEGNVYVKGESTNMSVDLSNTSAYSNYMEYWAANGDMKTKNGTVLYYMGTDSSNKDIYMDASGNIYDSKGKGTGQIYGTLNLDTLKNEQSTAQKTLSTAGTVALAVVSPDHGLLSSSLLKKFTSGSVSASDSQKWDTLVNTALDSNNPDSMTVTWTSKNEQGKAETVSVSLGTIRTSLLLLQSTGILDSTFH